MKAPSAEVRSVADAREINALEHRIIHAEDDADALLWEQALQVVAQLEAGLSQRALAADWINGRTGAPYSQMHVSYVRAVIEKHAFQSPRPRFREAYNAIAHAPAQPTCETIIENAGERLGDVRGAVGANGFKICPTCGSEWAADLALCPYCTIAPEARIEHVHEEQAPRLAVHFSSETPEHYTPRVIIDAALDCLGGAIDLDPCSNLGEPNVPAAHHFTSADDGLAHEWIGRVYMNPPYGREIDAWIEKLCFEHAAGRTTAAIALLPARPDTQWFYRLRDHLCCFVSGRLTFIGNDDPAPFPSVVVYLGEDIGAFYHAFWALGDIWQRIEPGMFGE
jgi:phage N-6-adenine-methyltransferase